MSEEDFYIKESVKTLTHMNVPERVKNFGLERKYLDKRGKEREQKQSLLASLKGGPVVVTGTCSLQKTMLTGFADSPIKEVGSLLLYESPVTSLEGMPLVRGNVGLHDCPMLTSLKGIQDHVFKDIDIGVMSPELSLADGPKRVDGEYQLRGFYERALNTLNVEYAGVFSIQYCNVYDLSNLRKWVKQTRRLIVDLYRAKNFLHVFLVDGVQGIYSYRSSYDDTSAGAELDKLLEPFLDGRHIFKAKLAMVQAGVKRTAKL